MKIFTFTLLLSFLSFASSAQEIKVLTYNIFHGENPQNPGIPNLDEIAHLIIQLQPDVVALQEVDSMTSRTEEIYGEKIDLVAELAKKTGYEGYFAKAMDYAEGGYGEGILVKKGISFSSQQLPTPSDGEARAVAWAKIELNSNHKVYFGATHLCHQFEENRIAQVLAIQEYAEELNLPAIWTGDLNFDPESKAYQTISSKWIDAGAVANDTSATYDSENGKRIDYVFYDSENFELIDYQVLDLLHSDHFPVLVTLKYIKP